MHKTILNRNSHHGHHQPQRNSVLSYLLLGFMLTGLAACGGGDDTQQNPGSGSASLTSPAYDGPVARDAQVLGYQNNVWERLRGEGACGRCHRSDAGIKQPPYFVDWLNVNNAYDAMIAYSPALVNLAEPEKSRLVTKVAEGHNCWLPSAAACATLITSYIESWASGSGGEAGRAIDLKPPTTLREPAATRFFPATFDGTNPGYTTVLNVPNDTDDYSIHSMLTTHCSGCHRSTAPDPQAPYFADPDPQTSYEAAQTKMDLNNPANSSFVLRLAAGHQIWDTAQNNSQDMQFLIEQFAGGITPNQVNNPETVSKALRFEEAVIASGGNRYEANQIALYEFRTGSGNTIVDTSGVMPELNLTLEGAEAPAGTRNGDYRWLTTYGVEFISPQAFAHATVANSKKLNDLIKLSGEYSIEAWVIPGNVTQENSNIVSYSAGTASEDRNFTLGQTMYNYDFIQLSSTTTDPFNDTLSTADAAERAQATLQHVVVTFDPINGRRIYVNGEYTGDADTSAPGNFADWNDGFALLFGGDSGGTRPWLGTLRMVSIHNRALNDAQIQQNYAVGVGQKYFMMFGVSHLTGTMGDPDYVGDAYVVFEVSQFDDYSYLFAKPRFLTKDTSLTPADINLNMRGMRIGVNGSLARVGQAYSTLDLTIGGGNYDPAEGQLLSPMGTILELKQGQQYDDFYLAFEQFGPTLRAFTDTSNTTPPPLPTIALDDRGSDLGMRTFEEINVTMSALTGVPRTHTQIRDNIYATYFQQLPAVANADAFLNSHQMAIAQMALNYCDILVNTNPGYFAGFVFSEDENVAFNSPAKRAFIINPLLEKMMNADLVTPANDLATQPTAGDLSGEIDALITRMISCEQPLPPEPARVCATGPARTAQIVKASCAAVLGSAVMQMQ